MSLLLLVIQVRTLSASPSQRTIRGHLLHQAAIIFQLEYLRVHSLRKSLAFLVSAPRKSLWNVFEIIPKLSRVRILLPQQFDKISRNRLRSKQIKGLFKLVANYMTIFQNKVRRYQTEQFPFCLDIFRTI